MKTTPMTRLDTSSGTEIAHNAQRHIVYRTRGHGEGFITRLMSPSELGRHLKPFVFLDIFNVDGNMVRAMKSGGGMPIHPHSGVATVTVIIEGFVRFDDPEAGTGEIAYGGVEWMRAGRGVWHGKEMSPGSESGIQGFQLWLALPPELENGAPESRYIEARDMRHVGPAHVIIGNYEDAQSPVPAPPGINYLLVTLKPGERWIYTPLKGHSIGWLALAKGALDVGETISAGEMVLFENKQAPISIQSTGIEDAVFVLGSAIPHPHPLHLGNYSVHTSAEALAIGESHIAELGRKLREAWRQAHCVWSSAGVSLSITGLFSNLSEHAADRRWGVRNTDCPSDRGGYTDGALISRGKVRADLRKRDVAPAATPRSD